MDLGLGLGLRRVVHLANIERGRGVIALTGDPGPEA